MGVEEMEEEKFKLEVKKKKMATYILGSSQRLVGNTDHCQEDKDNNGRHIDHPLRVCISNHGKHTDPRAPGLRLKTSVVSSAFLGFSMTMLQNCGSS